MAARRLTAALCCAAALGLARPAAAQPILRSMIVSVVDDEGIPVSGLGPADFIVREDNVSREVIRVTPADEPMHVALLVDTSSAARDNIQFYRSAIPPFVTALTNPTESGRRSQVSIIATGERPTVITDYTSSVAELQRGINRLWTYHQSGAYLLDSILETVQAIRKRELSRPVIVALSQEGGELSYRNYDQVLNPLVSSGAAFHVLMLGRPSASLSDEMRSRNIVIDEGPRRTGGFREQLLTPMALDGRLKLLADQLLKQYVVTFAHPDSLIPPEHVTVTAKNASLKARGTLVKDRFQQERK